MITQINNPKDEFAKMLVALDKVADEYPDNADMLIKYTSTPILSEEEVLERAEIMDSLMDMAKGENDIVLVFANAIADRIEDFERHLAMPTLSVPQRLKCLMDSKKLKQSDLKHIAPQSVISDILNNKREMNLKQARGLAAFFDLPVQLFIPQNQGS